MHKVLRALEEAHERGVTGGHGFAPVEGLSLHGGGGGGTSTIEKSDPWEGLQPHLRGLYNRARTQSHQNLTYPTGGTVAEQSEDTQEATQALAQQPDTQYQQAILDAGEGVVGNLGQSNPALQQYQSLGMSSQLALQDQLRGGDQGASVGEQAQQYAQQYGDPSQQQTQSGQLLNEFQSNPYTDQLVEQTLRANTENFSENVVPRIEGQAVASGGYGGSRQALAESQAADELNQTNLDAASQIYQQQFNQDRNRQIQLAGQTDQANINYANQNLNALGTGADIASAERELGLTEDQLRTQTAGSTLEGLSDAYATNVQGQSQGLAGLNVAQDLPLAPIEAQAQAGAAQDQYMQALLDDEVARHQFEQNARSQQLQQYAQLISSAGNPGGTRETSSPGPSTASGALGGAAAGAGLASSLSSAGAINSWNPWGWALMGGGALLGGAST